MKVLITGDQGFVGREFRQTLDDHDITGVDIKTGLDARDFFKSDDTRFDLVVHLAAVVGGRTTIESEPLRVATDLAIDSDMFQWALRTRPRRIVYYSSSAAYPVDLQGPGSDHLLREDDIDLASIRLPDFSYGWVKLTGEMLADLAKAEGLQVHVFRPFSGYGSDQDTDYPFPTFIDRALRRDDPFEIWGPGTQVRDFIHISDVVAGTMAAVENGFEGPLNLGTGRAVSFNNLSHLVCGAAGYTPEVKHLPTAPVGVACRVCDPTQMLSVYQPRISLEEGIARALKERA
jgi:nucleoside-diphosphate-sugar epimerase